MSDIHDLRELWINKVGYTYVVYVAQELDSICFVRKSVYESLAKDHADGWRRIQDAERALEIAIKERDDYKAQCLTEVSQSQSAFRERDEARAESGRWSERFLVESDALRELIDVERARSAKLVEAIERAEVETYPGDPCELILIEALAEYVKGEQA